MQAAGAVGGQYLEEFIPLFFTLEMGIYEDGAPFRFVAVKDMELRGVDEEVEIMGPFFMLR